MNHFTTLVMGIFIGIGIMYTSNNLIMQLQARHVVSLSEEVERYKYRMETFQAEAERLGRAVPNKSKKTSLKIN